MLKDLLAKKLSKRTFQKELEQFHAFDIAKSLETLSLEETNVLFNNLNLEQTAEIVAYLEHGDAARLLATFDSKKQIAIFNEMNVDDTVDILQSYEDSKLRDQIIKSLIDKEDVSKIITYDDDVVGAYISNDYVSLTKEMDVKEATTSLIKQADDAESINLLFVVDNDGHYLGAVNLKTLVKARSPKTIEEIMIDIPKVIDNSPVTEAVYDMKNYELYELPVTDKDNKLIGILTLDDIIDIATHEAEEDFEKLAALPATDKRDSWLKTALKRLPWLIILMFISIPLMTFSDFMVASISGIVILAFFQPLMLSSPGNVATQTLAVALKSITNEGKMSKKEVGKEFVSNLITSLLLGFITFVLSFLFVYFLQLGLPESAQNFSRLQVALIFASIIGGSLVIVVSLVSLLSIAVPHFFKLIKVDPAVASGPFITTIIDFFSTLVYFGLATLILLKVGML